MKRRLIICSSLITIILSCFSFPIFAEETVQDSSNLHTLVDGVLLDQYFYDNFDLLPYIDNTDASKYPYFDTGITGRSNLMVHIKFSDINLNRLGYIFGSRISNEVGELSLRLMSNQGSTQFRFSNYRTGINVDYSPYSVFDAVIDKNKFYFQNNLIYEFEDSTFNNDTTMSIFCVHQNSSYQNLTWFKLYQFSIFDYSANNGEGAYIRYYYPAKSKSSGIIGLYDAVNKTFTGSSSEFQFVAPTNEYVENFQISSFLTNSLTWIGQIFTAIIDMPIVIIFMAIGLAGAMFRWGRRIVHF